MPGDLIDRMMAFESGELGQDEVIALFQDLIDTGEVWKLQGFYGRAAWSLIESGYCHAAAGEPDPANGCSHVWGGDDVCCYCGTPKWP